MDLQINKGVQKKALKVCIYGVEGIGKSTFASQFPRPLFIDLDKGTSRLNVDRIDSITSWQELIQVLQAFNHPQENSYKTVIIDTADAAARLCEKFIIQTRAGGKKSIEDIGYGKGYKMLAEEFFSFMDYLELIIESGFNVVILAHATMKTITRPDDDGQYDHWELKLPGNTSNKLSPLVKEWADLLLFASYKTIIVEDGLKKKAKGGKRLMYTTHTPFADAKNRFGLADVLPFDYKEIAGIVEKYTVTDKVQPAASEKQQKAELPVTGNDEQKEKEEAVRELYDLMSKANLADWVVLGAIKAAGYYKDTSSLRQLDTQFIRAQLIAKWQNFSVFCKKKEAEFNKDIPF